MALLSFAGGELRILPDDECQIGIAARIFQKHATDHKRKLKSWNHFFFVNVRSLTLVGTRYAFSSTKSNILERMFTIFSTKRRLRKLPFQG